MNKVTELHTNYTTKYNQKLTYLEEKFYQCSTLMHKDTSSGYVKIIDDKLNALSGDIDGLKSKIDELTHVAR